jgi:hypothetical protein
MISEDYNGLRVSVCYGVLLCELASVIIISSYEYKGSLNLIMNPDPMSSY